MRVAELRSMVVDREILRADDLERLTRAHMRLQEALAFEWHGEIGRYDRDVDFLLGLASTKLARVALESGNLPLARQFTTWAERRRIPRNRRDEIINVLLGLKRILQ